MLLRQTNRVPKCSMVLMSTAHLVFRVLQGVELAVGAREEGREQIRFYHQRSLWVRELSLHIPQNVKMENYINYSLTFAEKN